MANRAWFMMRSATSMSQLFRACPPAAICGAPRTAGQYLELSRSTRRSGGAECHLSGVNGAGLGGGDEDLITLPNGQVDMTSLWLGSNTTCTSSNGGTTWLCNPNGSTVPADDRQWLANYGNNIVYITSNNSAR